MKTSPVDSGWGEAGAGGPNGESSVESYTSARGRDGRWACCVNWGSVTAREAGMGREVGSRVKRGAYVRLWLISVDAWQKPTQYCKAIILPLKINLKIF